ncbi:MAG: DUF4142 domain-containing protein, partial [Caulobacteraceae bacterium]
MTRSLLIAGAAVAAFGLAACQKPAEQAATPADTAAAATPAPASPAMAAADFVNAAASTDMFEIKEAKMALKRSTNADIKKFADMMIADHTKSTAALKAAIATANAGLAPPAALPTDMQAKVDALGKAGAADVDKTYIGQQVDAHAAALGVMQGYAPNGDTPALKNFAASTDNVVKGHLDEANRL